MAWLILGGGTSGMAAARLCSKYSLPAILVDKNPITEHSVRQLRVWGTKVLAPYVTNSLPSPLPTGVILSPGVPVKHPLVREALKNKIPVFSETGFALQRFNGKVAGITGTNGKSTTTEMLNHVLTRTNISSVAAGNIGLPVSEVMAGQDKPPEVLALELSSYQLEQSQGLKTDAGVFLNFTEDHLGRHGTMENYFRAKWSLLQSIRQDGLFLTGPGVEQTARDWGLKIPPALRHTRLEQKSADSLNLPDNPLFSLAHNRLNALAAVILAGEITGTPPDSLTSCLKDFQGLSHRCELIRDTEGRLFINDSKSTNVASTLVALESQNSPVILLAGGESKGESFKNILKHRHKIRLVLAFGQAAGEIQSDLSGELPLQVSKSLATLMEELPFILQKYGDPVLFSPACASFDEFRNFEDRGLFFKKNIRSTGL